MTKTLLILLIFALCILTIQDDKFYMAIVLPLRKSSLRKMIQLGHNNQEVNLKVLAKLKPIVCNYVDHGDLKVNSKN